MRRKIYYGSYQNQRRNDNKKRIVIIFLIVVGIIGVVGMIFAATNNGSNLNQSVQESVKEITQLKLKIKEQEDEIYELKAEIENYKAELQLRPAPSATPIVPPNDEVGAGQPANTPTTSPTSTPKATKKPVSTKKPQTPTQPPMPTPPPIQQEEIPPVDNNTGGVTTPAENSGGTIPDVSGEKVE